jgi:hypothetical protein
MNQRLTYSAAAPAVYKAMLALQASVDKSGLEKDLLDLVRLRHFTFRTSCHALCSICRGSAGERVRWLSHGERRQDRHDVSAVLSLAPRQMRM